MALLSTQDREDIRTQVSQENSASREDFQLTKIQLQEAINAVDEWIDMRNMQFNTTFPEPSKTNLTDRQKVRLFFHVVRKRLEAE